MLVVLAAVAGLWAADRGRVERIDYVTAIGEAGRPADAPAMIVPGRINGSYEWMEETRAMRQRGEWRLRSVDYENAPYGRPVYSSALYRAWLAVLAERARAFDGLTLALAIESAAKLADPLIQCLAVIALAIVAARVLGGWPAAWIAFSLAAAFPLGSDFLPGAPGERGLACVLALAMSLTLCAGVRAAFAGGENAERGARRAFLVAGALGGLGLWVSVSVLGPLLGGVALGGLAAGYWHRRGPALPWRVWSYAGAVAVVAAYLIEFAPGHLLDAQLKFLHPAFAVAWLAGGEAIARAGARWRGRQMDAGWKELAAWAGVVAGLACIPLLVGLQQGKGFLVLDLPAMQLARTPGAPSAVNLAALLRHDGLSADAGSAVLPLLLFVIGAAVLRGRIGPDWVRAALATMMGSALVAILWACWEIRAWDSVDIALIAVGALACAALVAWRPARNPVAITGLVLSLGLVSALWIPGAFVLEPDTNRVRGPLDEEEVYQLIERDFAWWLSAHAGAGGAVALAPQNLAYTLQYYGGVRGLATLSWDNRAGLQAAVRIASATTPEEAQELVDKRGITHLILPSWDSYMEVYARIGMGEMEGTFLSRLESWRLPPWLRPVSYPLPAIPGFESTSLLVLKVVPPQDEPTAVARIAEYFIDAGKLDQAEEVAATLRHYPANMGAWVARVEVALARGDESEKESALRVLLPRLNSAAIRNLPWERRVALGIVLAQAKRLDLAREPLRRCISQATEDRLKDLSVGSLYRLELLGRAMDVLPRDSVVWSKGLLLLPPDLQKHIETVPARG
jgi:hypothetical protein